MLTLDELERIVQQAEPAALLVPPRILRRVIKQHRRLGGLGLNVPHRKSYWLDRDALLSVATRADLRLSADAELPPQVVLLPLPDAAWISLQSRDAVLLKYWRLLFHAHVHLAIARRRTDSKLGEEALRDRIASIGATEFEEASAVVQQDHYLLAPGDPMAAYEEFAAVYLELRFFDPERIGSCFPAITDACAIERILAEDVVAATIFASTRPAGAPEPIHACQAHGDTATNATQAAGPSLFSAEAKCTAPLERADRVAARGNRVAAAVLRQAAADTGGADQRQVALDGARREIDELLNRLCSALQMPAGDSQAWREPSCALLARAAHGWYSVEARLLYDLQNACVDREREVYAVDLVEWFVSWGHRPVKRLLPHQPLLLAVKHLRSALHRANGVRIAEPLRLRLVELLSSAVHHAEHQLRERLRPVMQQALDKVGLSPANYAERVSRDKLVEELLDRAIERRFLGMGDLRDAIARNQLKLPDLAGAGELFLGDKLIRANRQFADDLDGVYRRGEIYLRWLQRLSSTFFGTRVGRFLTLFFILPFAGSYLSLEALHHVVEIFHRHPGHHRPVTVTSTVGLAAAQENGPLSAVSALVAEVHSSFHIVNRWSVISLALFLFAILHIAWFRHAVMITLTMAWHGLRRAVVDWPSAMVQHPWVRAVLDSRPYLILWQVLFKPLPWGLCMAFTCRLFRLRSDIALTAGVVAFVAAVVLYNSRIGLYVEEVCTDGVMRGWELFQRDLLPGAYRLVMALFKRLVGDVERVLYAVDELFRFRAGDSRFSLVWKPVLGLGWFFVTYLVRLFINLFVEPTFNPIKHFPVVTVTAKLIVPIIPQLTDLVVVPLGPIVGTTTAYTLAGFVIFFVPGLAGFLVWELKENWRLYRSNRPANLEPVMVGSHGETVVRLLRPGLHSGTLPKLYARLRHRHGTAAHAQHEALHHVAERVRYFVERDLFAVLAGSKRWAGLPLEIGAIQLATNRIRIPMRCAALAEGEIRIDFEEHSGLLTGGITLPSGRNGENWMSRLQPTQAAALRDAVAGFVRLAGIDGSAHQAGQCASHARLSDAIPPIPWTNWVQTWAQDQQWPTNAD